MGTRLKAVVTGANAGIGKAITKGLAQQDYQVVMVGRNTERLEQAKQDIIQETGNEHLSIEKADLSSFQEVNSLGNRLQQQYQQLDVLINNAGLLMTSRQLTQDGNEMVFQVNYLSHFLLTHQLLPLLRKSEQESRIINVSSGLHKIGSIYFDDPHMEEKYSGVKAYGQSKLALILLTYELDRRLDNPNLCVNAVNPGAVATQFASKHSHGLIKFFWKIYQNFIKGVEQGAATPLYVATSDDLNGVSGKYFEKKRVKSTSSESYNKEVAQRLWSLSEELTGITMKV